MIAHQSLHKWLKCGCGYSKMTKELITLKDYLMGRDELYKSEYTNEIRDNALLLLSKVNSLLTELGLTDVKVSSGWRPVAVNQQLANSSKRSLHMIGLAVDLQDKDKSIYKLIIDRPELLKKYSLWLERAEDTPDWTHLDLGQRVDRPIRVFKA